MPETLAQTLHLDSELPAGTVVSSEELGAFQFHKKLKKGKRRLVSAPVLEGAAFDVHCHLDSAYSPALEIARCAARGVDFLCTVVEITEESHTLEKLEEWRQQAAEMLVELGASANVEMPHIRIVVGCHPHNAKDFTPEVEAALREYVRDARVCAIGEIGLDYHYDLSPREVQQQVFRTQIRLAHELGFPVQLHLREAHNDAYKILCEEGFPAAGVVLHCFNLDAHEIQRWVDKGCYISLGGALTFKALDELREAAAICPEELLLTETDSPYMTPEPMRGTTCGPHHVIFTADCLASVRGFQAPEERQAFFARIRTNAETLLDRGPLPCQVG